MIKNNKLISTLSVIIIAFLLIGLTNAKLGGVINVDKKVNEKIILVDPGHGGMDGGAVSKNGTIEKDINLAISLKLKKELAPKGYTIIMTREEDKGLYSDKGTIRDKKNEDLNNRCKLKKTSGCDMFISIHLNIFPQEQYYGAQVWYSNNEGSKRLADTIQKNLILDLQDGNNRKCKPAKDLYKVLRSYDEMPSVLVECGFLSNYNEEQQLKNDEYQQKLANCIAKSVDEYFK